MLARPLSLSSCCVTTDALMIREKVEISFAPLIPEVSGTERRRGEQRREQEAKIERKDKKREGKWFQSSSRKRFARAAAITALTMFSQPLLIVCGKPPWKSSEYKEGEIRGKCSLNKTNVKKLTKHNNITEITFVQKESKFKNASILCYYTFISKHFQDTNCRKKGGYYKLALKTN